MRLDDVASRLSCKLEGDGSIEILGVATLEAAKQGDLSFLTNTKYRKEAEATRASAVVLGLEGPKLSVPLLRHSNPYLAFAKAVELFFTPAPIQPGVHPTAWVSDSAVLGRNVYIGPFCFVGERVVLGDDVRLHSRCTVHEDAMIGDQTSLHSGCVIREGVIIGRRCIVQSNSVLGSDGFGYAKQDGGEWYRIIQAGTLIVEDDVEIGACSTIDRATLGETRIQSGTKIDNQVQIGHGCKIGTDNLLCAQVGLAGSTRTGSGVVLTGQVGAAGHLTIGDGVIATPQTGIANSVEAGEIISGAPAMDHRSWLKSSAVLPKLPDLQKALRQLEARVSALEAATKE